MRFTAWSATAVVAGLCACKSTMAPITQQTPPPAALRCAPTPLTLDTNYTGVLNASAACRTRDLLNGESTYVRFYDLSLLAGRGYLVTMQPMGPAMGLLELTTPDTLSPTLLAASRDRSGRAELLFAASATETVRIRATTLSGTPADTGGFALLGESCKVPVPAVTNFSLTHSDTTTLADCQLSLSALDIGDGNVSSLHLYLVHATGGSMARLVTFSASAPVRVFFGGPHHDTFGQVGPALMGYLDSATVGTSFYFAPGGGGDYTLAIGGDQGLPTRVSYTLTIGAEQPLPTSPSVAAVRTVGR